MSSIITLPSITDHNCNNPPIIATLDNEKARLIMDMTVGTGRGFVSADAQAEQTQASPPIGVILVDAIYSPVLHVNFTVEHVQGFESMTKVEGSAHLLDLQSQGSYIGWLDALDKIILEVTTDGTLSPDEASCLSTDILRQQFAVLRDYQCEGDVPTEQHTTLSTVPIPRHIYDTPVEILGFSTRVQNSFRRYGIAKGNYSETV